MKLIGAGFPRTGTLSTKTALESIGFDPCYHFFTQMERPQDVAVWRAAAEGQSVDWTALFADFQAAIDWPESLFYKQLMAVYPEAKVLLTMRDPESWYESMMETVYPASQASLAVPPDNPLSQAGRAIDAAGWQGLFHGRFEDKAYAISVFERRIQEVKDFVPADKLLVWKVQDGWEPLCRFLGVAVPDRPFPRLNDREAFQTAVRQMQGHEA